MSKSKKVEHENHERWLVSYADFITLLFAFFVVLYATSTENKDKEKEFEESIRQEFKMGSGGAGAGQSVANQGAGQALIDPLDGLNRRRSNLQDLEDQIKRIVRKELTEEQIANFGLQIRTNSFGVLVSFNSNNLFLKQSIKLNNEYIKTLRPLFETLKLIENKVIIESILDSSIEKEKQIIASMRALSLFQHLKSEYKYNDDKVSIMVNLDQNSFTDKPIHLIFLADDTVD